VKGGQKSVNITPGQYYTLSNSMAKWSKPGVDGKKTTFFKVVQSTQVEQW
jgi:hypothetical protein